MNLAIIPARGGSKRIPSKNSTLFAGKPLIAYSIEAAIHSAKFTKIIVSTDSQEIADTAISHGADVPFIRPESLSGDYVGTGPVTKHAIEHCIPIVLPRHLVQDSDTPEDWLRVELMYQAYVQGQKSE
jgi:pseudaminic acid cytidylyltransferase